jgi:hypothetical protein
MKSKQLFTLSEVSEIYNLARLLGALQWDGQPTKQQIKIRNEIRKRKFYATDTYSFRDLEIFKRVVAMLPLKFRSFNW